eukprot:GHVT01072857.1.p1 GENE.GHVT01072857.1~~GHVT01072857.1.p1  ORF type:complete len:374 (-),score=95.70 GHVT01072857.1:2259-3380(-)
MGGPTAPGWARRLRAVAALAAAIVVADIAPALVEAWWDEGHMMIGAIAKLNMDAGDVAKLESILAMWEEDYPGLSTIPTSAVWADKLKCTHLDEYCAGLRAFDAFELFNQWHFISLPFNPESIHLDALESQAGRIRNNARWALDNLFGMMTPRGAAAHVSHQSDSMPIGPSDQFAPDLSADETSSVAATSPSFSSSSSSPLKASAATSASPSFSAEFQSSASCASSSSSPCRAPTSISPAYPRAHRGSHLSWNLGLRLFIHVFGDVHQPLHAINAFYKQRPNGDRGGTEVPLDVSSLPATMHHEVRSLHALWDSAGGSLTAVWPVMRQEGILQEVCALTRAATGAHAQLLYRATVQQRDATWAAFTSCAYLTR